jgi:hypothetical protein
MRQANGLGHTSLGQRPRFIAQMTSQAEGLLHRRDKTLKYHGNSMMRAFSARPICLMNLGRCPRLV